MTMDNWERGMEALNASQRYLLEELLPHLQQRLPADHGSGLPMRRVDPNYREPTTMELLARTIDLMQKQAEFNRTVIQMLTNLDYRLDKHMRDGHSP